MLYVLGASCQNRLCHLTLTDEDVGVLDSAHFSRLPLPVGYSALAACLTSSTPVRHRRQRAEAFTLRYSRLSGKHVHACVVKLLMYMYMYM